MPKPKLNKKKSDQKKSLYDATSTTDKGLIEHSIRESRKDEFIPLHKRILIVGEGPTEYCYFEGLCSEFDVKSNYTVVIAPDKNTVDQHKGSSVKGLLYEALKMQQDEKIPFDEVWIVTDNDEENAYKLDDHNLLRLKTIVPEEVFKKMKPYQKYEMNVRDDEDKNRIRYFLSTLEYENFLKDHILEKDNYHLIDQIISNTNKKDNFTKLYDGYTGDFFFDAHGKFVTTNSHDQIAFEEKYFSDKWLKDIKVAYSCIAFEYWILLHFEENVKPFYNSKELIKYMDDKSYFAGNYEKGKKRYEKGWFLYENLRNPEIKKFFTKVHQAIRNNIYLNSTVIPPDRKFYEINPYSDVHKLTSILLSKTIVEQIITHEDFKDIKVEVKLPQIIINFRFNKKQSWTSTQIEDLFSVTDVHDKPIQFHLKLQDKEKIIRTGQDIAIIIEIKEFHATPCLLKMQDKDSKTKETLIWIINTRYNI